MYTCAALFQCTSKLKTCGLEETVHISHTRFAHCHFAPWKKKEWRGCYQPSKVCACTILIGYFFLSTWHEIQGLSKGKRKLNRCCLYIQIVGASLHHFYPAQKWQPVEGRNLRLSGPVWYDYLLLVVALEEEEEGGKREREGETLLPSSTRGKTYAI